MVSVSATTNDLINYLNELIITNEIYDYKIQYKNKSHENRPDDNKELRLNIFLSSNITNLKLNELKSFINSNSYRNNPGISMNKYIPINIKNPSSYVIRNNKTQMMELKLPEIEINYNLKPVILNNTLYYVFPPDLDNIKIEDYKNIITHYYKSNNFQFNELPPKISELKKIDNIDNIEVLLKNYITKLPEDFLDYWYINSRFSLNKNYIDINIITNIENNKNNFNKIKLDLVELINSQISSINILKEYSVYGIELKDFNDRGPIYIEGLWEFQTYGDIITIRTDAKFNEIEIKEIANKLIGKYSTDI